MTPAEFVARVDVHDDGCWTIGLVRPDKYSRLTVDGVRDRAHKVSWRVHHGPIPHGHGVLHKCHFKPCCNPDHLHTGDQSDNAVDMMLVNGQWSKRDKPLTIADVTEILRAEGRVTDIAAALGFDYRTVFNIRTGRTWGKFRKEGTWRA